MAFATASPVKITVHVSRGQRQMMVTTVTVHGVTKVTAAKSHLNVSVQRFCTFLETCVSRILDHITNFLQILKIGSF